MNTTTKDIIVIYHRADFDGLFCREIAKHHLGEAADYIGWDYGDPVPVIPAGTRRIFILDLSVRELMDDGRVIWIDHHMTAKETYSPAFSGYRIDGVAACRLAWQWFAALVPGQFVACGGALPEKQAYLDRLVAEPLAVRLAGEYDIWDKRDPRADLFQHGLRSCDLAPLWPRLLDDSEGGAGDQLVAELLAHGEGLAYAKRHENESIIRSHGFTVQFEGLTFLACNAARYNSHLFTAGLRPEHDGCLGFNTDGKKWRVSLYGVPGKPEIDFSAIAKRYGGGGHKQACGFEIETLPFSKEAAEIAKLRAIGEGIQTEINKLECDSKCPMTDDQVATVAWLVAELSRLRETAAENARMLRRFAVECYPDVVNGQVHFVRALMESAADELDDARKEAGQ